MFRLVKSLFVADPQVSVQPIASSPLTIVENQISSPAIQLAHSDSGTTIDLNSLSPNPSSNPSNNFVEQWNDLRPSGSTPPIGRLAIPRQSLISWHSTRPPPNEYITLRGQPSSDGKGYVLESTIFSYPGPPNQTLGHIGDLFLDTNANQIYKSEPPTLPLESGIPQLLRNRLMDRSNRWTIVMALSTQTIPWNNLHSGRFRSGSGHRSMASGRHFCILQGP